MLNLLIDVKYGNQRLSCGTKTDETCSSDSIGVYLKSLLLQDGYSDNSMFAYFCLKTVTPKI